MGCFRPISTGAAVRGIPAETRTHRTRRDDFADNAYDRRPELLVERNSYQSTDLT
jgi:hypothetical protein